MLRSLPLLLLLPAVAFGQTPEVVAKVDAKLDAERAAQRNEDVEILRRLLNKTCGLPDGAEVRSHKANPTGGSTVVGTGIQHESDLPASVRAAFILGQPLGSHTTATPVGPFDGVYLPGAGIVYTLHVPAGAPTTAHGERIGLNSSCGTCHQEKGHTVSHAAALSASQANCTACHADVPKGEPVLSDWERTRMDVRGQFVKRTEKPDDKKPKAAVCEPGNLQSVIAGVLTANAKNVRHLPEKEGVTVVVTFDEVGGKARASMAFYNGDLYARFPADWQPKEPATLPAKPGFTPDELKALSLGDLHLKQGKYATAVFHYHQVLNKFTAKEWKLDGLAGLPLDERRQCAEEFQGEVRKAMAAYAKALLLSDQMEQAKQALELATGFVVLEVTPTTVPAKSTAPAKLILTVSKTDIDAAKDDAAAKKAVKAERVNFPK